MTLLFILYTVSYTVDILMQFDKIDHLICKLRRSKIELYGLHNLFFDGRMDKVYISTPAGCCYKK